MNKPMDHAGVWGRRPGPLARAALLAAFGLVASAEGACNERSAAPVQTVGSPPVAVQPARVVRSYMLSHYADTVGMRNGLIAGNLADFQTAASAVARDDWAPSSKGDPAALVARVRSAASAAQAAPSLAAGAAALGSLGEACAACHLESGGPESPVAPEDSTPRANSRMFGHAVAAERLWAGLVLPSEESWMSGMQLLAAAPFPDDRAEASASRHLRDLARRGQIAAVDQRGSIFGDVLGSCSECHERQASRARQTTPGTEVR